MRATLQVRAWDNMSGSATTWELATIRGASPLFDSDPLGDMIMALPADLVGLQSFNIAVPEPGTVTLSLLAGILFAFGCTRRRTAGPNDG
jgi:hypothetical protein